ncbi:PREDICTED: isoflavone reductase [Prunus dulcis]|uniref:PREDICTED: isoflavone reductase n=1 Tax=Prunus dulcis TaxID=3755 RepID=A0A5E4EQF1_PRUDU|nr:leucoanthocyanidin reductase-like [Prunus dulcis]VVA17904.1 PREDICTED: isoflavone reductase [Prunus dulcis]
MTVSTCVSAAKNGRILIVGATGFIGRFVAEASLDAGQPTYVLIRPGPHDPSKADIIKSLKDRGAIILHGVISDKALMEKLLREHEIEVVISAVGGTTILDQIILVGAIQAVGTIKRFLPSEFGHDVDRADPVEPGLTMYLEKRQVRRCVEKSGVPYTYICCNSIASWPYFDNKHPSEVLPPLDQFQIYGDGNVKAYFIDGADIGKFTMKTVDDIRTMNKNVHFRPPSNLYDINGLASLWEKKIGRTLPRVTITEDDLLTIAAEKRIPESIVASFTHDIFIKGCQVNFPVDGPHDVEIGTLYPGESFRTLDECFNDFLLKLEDEQELEKNKVSTKTTAVVEPRAVTATCA